ncbi:hypothetical protein ACFL4X_00215 [Gemmatimonadota bacterium]
MKAFSALVAVMFSVMVCAGAALAAEQDYTWSLSGTLDADMNTSFIYIGVNNSVDQAGIIVELHYDTSLVERLSEKLIGRAADMTLTTNLPSAAFRRFLIYDATDPPPPVPIVVEAGSDSIIQVGFRVKDGVAQGALVSMYLTTTTNRVAVWDTLVVPTYFEIEGSIWDNPGDPKEMGWNMKGLAVADSNATEVFILLNNSLWVADMVLDLAFDPLVLEIVTPASDVTLKGRATDVNLDVAYGAGSGAARLTFSKTSSTPPFPVIDPGNGTIAGIKFSVVGALADGDTTELDLALDDGTALTTFQLAARAYSGPTADVDGNGAISIFDVIAFLSLWPSSPPNPFTDVNGDGKSDVFDLLAILTAMKQ